MPKHTAVVLSLFDTGLGAVRSLGRAGIPVIGLDCSSTMSGLRSRYCTATLSPDPVRQPEELVQFLLEEGRRLERPGILFAASDAYTLFLSRYRDALSACYRFNLPSATVLEAMLNKRLQYEMAEKVGTPCARTCYPETIEEVERIKADIEYPSFIKPYCAHLWREKFGSTQKGFKVHTPEELIARFKEILPTGLQVMVQSIIPGPNTNHFKICAYIDQNGEPLALFTLRKIRQYPTEFGTGTLVESLRFPELVDLGLKFLQGIDYRGIGSIEFKIDDRDGKLKLIELNPRLWQQNIHATDCGMDFPLIEYLDLTDQSPALQTEFKEGVRWFDSMADFQSFWSYYREGKLSPCAWVRSWIGARSFATFALDDLGPFFKNNQYGLKYLRAPLYVQRQR